MPPKPKALLTFHNPNIILTQDRSDTDAYTTGCRREATESCVKDDAAPAAVFASAFNFSAGADPKGIAMRAIISRKEFLLVHRFNTSLRPDQVDIMNSLFAFGQLLAERRRQREAPPQSRVSLQAINPKDCA